MDRQKQTSYTSRPTSYRGRRTKSVATSQEYGPVEHATSVRKKHTFAWTKRSLLVVVGLLILCIGGGATYAQLGPSLTQSSTTGVNLQKGLLGWWKLDGNTNDSGPNRYALANNGASLNADREGIANKSYSFNGTSNALSSGSGKSGLPTLNGSHSISIWFNSNQLSGNRTMFTLANSSQGTQYRINNSSLQVTSYGGAVRSTAGASMSINTWYLATFTFDGSTWRIYLNGNLITTGSGTAQSTAADRIYIGSYGGGEYWNGSLDDARLYNRALNANEVKTLYAQYNPTTNIGSGEKGLVGWWKMDGNANDNTPYRNNGVLASTTSAQDRKNLSNKAYSFNGTTSNIEVTPNSSLAMGVKNWGLSAWVKPSSSSGTIISSRQSSARFGYALQLSAGKVRACFYTAVVNGPTCIDSSNVISMNTWHHLAASYDRNANLTLYVDGVQDTSISISSYSGTSIQIGAGFKIGAEGNGAGPTSGYFSGVIDDARVYSRILTSAEVSNIYKSYNSQISINNTSNSVNTSTGLVGYWPFNGNANDSTPYRSNGTLSTTPPTLIANRNSVANSAYNFTGGSDIKTSSSQIYNMKTFTYSAWIKPTSSSGTQTIINSNNAGGAQGGAQFRYIIGKLQLVRATIADVCLSTGTVSPGVWSHVVVTYDTAGTCTFYINGTNAGSSTNLVPFISGYLRIGARESFAEYFNGDIDNVSLYNRVLSPGDINKMYSDYR